MDGLRYGGETGEGGGADGAVAGQRLVPETIFNLKLPMKKRYEEVSQNLAYIQAQLDEHGVNAQIRARQLYHDREEGDRSRAPPVGRRRRTSRRALILPLRPETRARPPAFP